MSAFNSTVQDLRRSFKEGQRLAHLHNIQDYETTLQELQGHPEELRAFKEVVQDPLIMRQLWHAMFLSGMLPFEHFDRPIVEAHAAGNSIFCVDMPQYQAEQLAECAPLHGDWRKIICQCDVGCSRPSRVQTARKERIPLLATLQVGAAPGTSACLVTVQATLPQHCSTESLNLPARQHVMHHSTASL